LALAFADQAPSHALIKRIVDDLACIEHALAGDDWHRSHEEALRRH
jgi:HPt (histidine-containing phosphotransfer) domain-containing protein